MMNLTAAFATVWNALLTAVKWTKEHGITLAVDDASITVSFFTIAIAFAVIRLVIGVLPIFGDESEDE